MRPSQAPQRLTVLQERALTHIAGLPSVRITDQTCIPTAEYNPNEVTLGRAVADELLRAGVVEYVSYRRVRITEKGRKLVEYLGTHIRSCRTWPVSAAVIEVLTSEEGEP